MLLVVCLLPVAGVIKGWVLKEYPAMSGGWRFLLIVFDVLRTVLAVVFLVSVLSLIYHVGPGVKHRFHWVTPGAVFCIIVWVVLGLSFRLYIEKFGKYEKTYGTVGGVAILLLIFFYIDAHVLLIGAEVNSEIDAAVLPVAPGTVDLRPAEDEVVGEEEAEKAEKSQRAGSSDERNTAEGGAGGLRTRPRRRAEPAPGRAFSDPVFNHFTLDLPDPPLPPAVGAEEERPAHRVPRRAVVPALVRRDLHRLARLGQVEHPDVVVARLLSVLRRPVGGEGDARAVARPGGVDFVDVRRVGEPGDVAAADGDGAEVALAGLRICDYEQHLVRPRADPRLAAGVPEVFVHVRVELRALETWLGVVVLPPLEVQVRARGGVERGPEVGRFAGRESLEFSLTVGGRGPDGQPAAPAVGAEQDLPAVGGEARHEVQAVPVADGVRRGGAVGGHRVKLRPQARRPVPPSA